MTLLTHYLSNFTVVQVDPVPLPARLANALVSYAAYIGQSFYPVNLSPYYPHRGPELPLPWAVEAFVLLLAISVIVAIFWRRLPFLLVGWLWFLGVLVPLLGLVGAFFQSRADNYTYLSQIGLSIAVAWSVCSAYRWRQSLLAQRWRSWTLAILSAASLLALSAAAWRQTSYWRDTEAVWTRATACTEQNALGHYCLGDVYDRQGRRDEAIEQFRAGLSAYSSSRFMTAETHWRLAYCLSLKETWKKRFSI